MGLILLVIAGCQSPPSAPSWVAGAESANHPKSRFMTSIGTGRDYEEAAAHAKAELSRVFAAELESELELIETESLRDGRTQTQTDLFLETRISTGTELEGVEIVSHWQERIDERGDMRIWALAALERIPECRRIRSEAQRERERLDAERIERRASRSPLEGLAAAMRSVRVAERLDLLVARSRVLGFLCVPAREESTGSLLREVADRQARLHFRVEGFLEGSEWAQPGGRLPRLEEQVAAGLASLGFRVAPRAGSLEHSEAIPIDARLRLSPVARGTSWTEIRWEGSFSIGGSDRVSSEWGAEESLSRVGRAEGSESHPEFDTAVLRARLRGEEDLARQIDTLLRRLLGIHEGKRAGRRSARRTERIRSGSALLVESVEVNDAVHPSASEK